MVETCGDRATSNHLKVRVLQTRNGLIEPVEGLWPLATWAVYIINVPSPDSDLAKRYANTNKDLKVRSHT